MSINHFSPDIPEALWWTQQHQQQQQRQQHHQQQQSMNMEHHHHHQNMSLNFNLNQYDVVEEDEEEDHKKTNNELPDGGERDRETMFEKPLTPSDVGKLNRLVIPKQHAEKYFPLNNHNHQHHHSNGGGDSVSGGENKGGLLLSFEDESGKWWRFRYSYWNSSQSYVLTKGWSRYVKEKSLYAGDVVLFERHRSDLDRFFIGWRRRDTPPPIDSQQPTLGGGGGGGNNDGGASSSGGGGGWTRVFYSAHPYPSHPFPYQPDCLHAGSMEVGEAKTTPVGNSKRLIRLFGVNMECEQDESESSMSVSNQSQDHQGQGEPQNVHNYSYYNPETHGYPIHHNHMIQDVNFSRDVNQMINRRG